MVAAKHVGSLVLIAVAALSPACTLDDADPIGGGTDAGTTTRPDGGTVAPPPRIDATGSYAIDGAWDLSAPIGGDRTLGVVAGELFVEETLALAGLPSAIEGEARGVLMDRIGAEIRTWVDARTPAELQAGSPFMRALAETTAQIDYESELTLAASSTAVGGVETFRRVSVDRAGTTYEAPLDAILPAAPDAVVAETDFRGTASASALSIDPHVVQLRYGLLIVWLTDEVLGGDAAALKDAAIDALVCDAIVAELTDGTGALTIEVATESVTIPAGDLLGACERVRGEVSARALGIFAYDTPIEVGGPVLLVDADADRTADEVIAGDAHGGLLLLGGPRATSPRIASTFIGARQ